MKVVDSLPHGTVEVVDDIEIGDDTGLNVADSVDFQEISYTDDESVRQFLDGNEDVTKPHRMSVEKNPWVRIGIGCAGLAFVLGFIVVFSLGRNTAEVAEDGPVDSESEALTLSLDKSNSGPAGNGFIEESDNPDQMRSEIALLEQRMALREMERGEEPNPLTLSQPTPTTQPTPTPTRTTARVSQPRAQPRAQPATVVRTPVPRAPVVRPSAPAPVVTRRAPQPVSRAAAPAATPSAARINTRDYEPPDPQEQWKLVSNLGIIGQSPTVEAPQTVESEVQIISSNEPAYQLKTAERPSPPKPRAVSVDYRDSAVSQEPTSTASSNVPGLYSVDSDYIPLGQVIRGNVRTPITWGNDGQYIVSVEEDILDARGNVAISAGNEVIVQTGNLDPSSGIAELFVVGVSNGGSTSSVDYRNFIVGDKDGGLLVANRSNNNRGAIAAVPNSKIQTF